MACAHYSHEEINHVGERTEIVKVKTESNKLFEVEHETITMVQIKIEPGEVNQNYDGELPFVCDGIVKKEVPAADYAEESHRMASTSEGYMDHNEEFEVPNLSSYDHADESNDIDATSEPEKLLTSKEVETTVPKLFKCPYCVYASNYRSTFVGHIRRHTGEKPYKCEQCDFRCSQKTILNRHVRTHTGEKPFGCKFCNYKCADGTTLRGHERRHKGDKRFECDICGYKCVAKGDLVKHKRIHTDERPLGCSLCDYKCSSMSHLKTHLRKHTGEKPFTCPLCDYESSVNSNVTAHMKRMHK